jgi:hypothetical protein
MKLIFRKMEAIPLFMLCLLSLFSQGQQTTANVQQNGPGSREYERLKASLKKDGANAGAISRQSFSGGVTTLNDVSNCLPTVVPIAGEGGWSVLAGNDDGSLGPISLGFQFNLYGSSYSSLYINNNGNISFGQPLEAYNPSGFPIQLPMISPFWADVDTRLCGQVFYRVLPTRLEVYYYQVG